MRSKIKKNHEFFELSKFRRRFMLLVLLTLFCILFSRAFFLQGMQKDFLQQEGFERSNRNIELYAYRGKIYDRNNQILAASETVRSITMEPNRVEFKKGDKLKKLPCGHLFHQECISEWFQRKMICPNCKFSVIDLKVTN